MPNPPTHASVLKRWSKRRQRSKLAQRLSDLRSTAISHVAVLGWEQRSLIPVPWRDAVAQLAQQDGHQDVTRESLDEAAEILRARKRHPTKTARRTQPQPEG